MATSVSRLVTFGNCPRDKVYNALLLSRHGFQFCGQRNQIECADCKKQLELPNLTAVHDSTCRFLRTAEKFLSIRTPTYFQFCEWRKFMEEFGLTMDNPSCPLEEDEIAAFQRWQFFKNVDRATEQQCQDPEYAQHETRMASFRGAGLDDDICREMARSGFWYFDDRIQCAYCGITFLRKSWPKEGEGMKQHRHNSPECPYLKAAPISAAAKDGW